MFDNRGDLTTSGKVIMSGALVLIIAALIVAFTTVHQTQATVTGQHWSREMQVEIFLSRRFSDWD